MSKDFSVFKEQGVQLGLAGAELKEYIREEISLAHERFMKERAKEKDQKLAEEKQAMEIKAIELKSKKI